MSIAVRVERFLLTATIERKGILMQFRIDARLFNTEREFLMRAAPQVQEKRREGAENDHSSAASSLCVCFMSVRL
jgi:hypothetical protein